MADQVGGPPDNGKTLGFDYIIVGAGSAGCVLAYKLGSNPDLSILIIEAGPPDRDLMIHIPAGVYSAYKNPKLNWNYLTENEPHLMERNVEVPRGKVVGGSSSINSMVYMRGHPLDYDIWAKGPGMEAWDYSQCLPYFKAGERYVKGANEWRGDSGMLGVSAGNYHNPLYDAFIEAGDQAGQGRTDDPNGFQPEGVARLDSTKWNGRRCSAAVAFLRPALKRGNVTLLTNAQVEKVILSGRKAEGVVFRHKGQTIKAHADCEVILSGGAINSPQVLMVSGIGPRKHLEEHGIEVKHNLPGVGQNLQDHASIILQYECLKSFPIHRVNSLSGKAIAGALWVFSRKGIAASNIWEAGGLIRGNDSVAYPNLQYHFGPVGFRYQGTQIELLQAFAIHVDQLRPKSRGAVTLASADPFHKPLMTFNYYHRQSDLDEMVEGVAKTRDLVSQNAFDGLRGKEIEPGPAVRSRSEILNWVRSVSATDYHPCGTCAMGEGGQAVVDAQLRVHGIENLRVVDASVMPRIISGNLNAPVQMMAARAADYISASPQLPPVKARFAFNS